MNIELEMPDLEDGLLTVMTETVPYLTKETPSGADRLSLKLVGGTVALNQMVRDGDFTDETHTWQSENIYASLSIADGVATVTLTETAWNVYTPALSLNRQTPKQADACYKGHKYIIALSIKSSIGGTVYFGSAKFTLAPPIYTPAGEWVDAVRVVNCTGDNGLLFSYIGIGGATGAIGDSFQVKRVAEYDLTLMFGSTIADYVYSLEQSTAGSGIAWLKSYGWFTEDYYPYNAGELLSVKTSGHQSITLTPLSDIELRGMPKLVNNQLQYDGDSYDPSGQVTRKYGVATFDGSSDENWSAYASYDGFFIPVDDLKVAVRSDGVCNMLTDSKSAVSGQKMCFWLGVNTKYIYLIGVYDTFGSTVAELRTYLATHNLVFVYPLETQTTETTTPFSDPIPIGSTEEFIDNRSVPMPVGNVSEYKNAVKMQTIQLFMP